MNLNIRNYDESKYIPKFQEGGQMMEEAPMEGAPVEEAPVEGAPGGEGDPMMELMNLAAQAVQSNDCEAAMTVCQVLLQMVQGQEAPQEQPVFKMGGKLSRTLRK